MDKIEHIGIAVKDLTEAITRYEKLLGTKCYKIEEVESQGVKTAFFNSGPNKIELLEGLNTQSVISKYVDKKGEGIHHIAYAVEDIYKEIERLKGEGFEVLMDPPQKGADGKIVTFIHPKETNGVLTELCMDA